MSLSTASFDNLRDRNNRDIEKAEQRLAALHAELPPPPSLQQSIDKVEARRKRLFEHRSEVETTASSLKQQEWYGVDLWHTQYVRLRDVKVPPNCSLSVQELRDQLWKMIPSGKFKRFQEVFSIPSNYVVPRFTVTPSGNVRFLTRTGLSALSVAGCLVSPDRIPDEMAERLGLASFYETESPFARLKKKARLLSINQLKALWDAALPLNRGDLRVLVITKPSELLLQRYGSSALLTGRLEGTFFYTREQTNGKASTSTIASPTEYSPKRVQHFSSAFDAYRKTLWAGAGYSQERAALIRFNVRIDRLKYRLSHEWKRDTSPEIKEELANAVINTIADGIQLLERSVDGHKARAGVLLERVKDAKDSLGRRNPGVVSNRLSYALLSLKKRLEEAFNKSGFNFRDGTLVKDTLIHDATVVSDFRRTLVQTSAKFLRLETPSMFPVRTEFEARTLLRQMVPDIAALESIKCRPFLTSASMLKLQYRALRTALIENDEKGSLEALLRMNIIGQFSAATVLLEKAKEAFATGNPVPVSSLQKELGKLHDVMGVDYSSRLARTDSFSQGQKALFEKINGLSEQLGEIAMNQDMLPPRSEEWHNLRKSFGAIDPEEMLIEMRQPKK